MDLFHNLFFGFSVAVSLQNLMYCLIGVSVGTLIGVLPGIGPLAPFDFSFVAHVERLEWSRDGDVSRAEQPGEGVGRIKAIAAEVQPAQGVIVNLRPILNPLPVIDPRHPAVGRRPDAKKQAAKPRVDG